jgi:hypothetical protein
MDGFGSQLSIAVGVPVAIGEVSLPQSTVTSGAHVIIGGTASVTVTVKVQGALNCMARSAARQVTVDTPRLNREPELTGPTVAPAEVHVTITPGQLSFAVTVKATAASHRPGSIPWVIEAGHETVGGWLSVTVTLKPQGRLLNPLASVAVQDTNVTPLLKREPELTGPVVAPDATQANVCPGQLSAVVTVNDTGASHRPGSVTVIMGAGQAMVGGCVSTTLTVKVHEEDLPQAFTAVQVTGVAGPVVNVVPDGGTQLTVTAPEQQPDCAVAE